MWKAKHLFLTLLLLEFTSCMKIEVDKSYQSSSKTENQYRDILSLADLFIEKYNKLLKEKVHDSFIHDFYFNDNFHFNVQAIFSKSDNLLVYIERNNLNENKFHVYYTEENPQVYIQELKSSSPINITPHPSQFSFLKFSEGTGAFITEVNYVNFPIPYEFEKDNYVATFNQTIKLEQPGDSLITSLPGISLLLSTSTISSFQTLIDSTFENMFNFELQKKYFASEFFRKALSHPILKDIASNINERKSMAENKDKEYPFWEFERDINKMREIAKQNNIEDNYVDEMIKDPQYRPIAGSLLYYYGNEYAFMLQWTLINVILFFILLLSYLIFPSSKLLPIQITFSTILLVVNGWVFSKKPDLINLKYWILPSLSLLSSFILIYFKNIFNLFRHE